MRQQVNSGSAFLLQPFCKLDMNLNIFILNTFLTFFTLWGPVLLHLFYLCCIFCCPQSKLASMSNDFKSVLEVRTEVSKIHNSFQNSLLKSFKSLVLKWVSGDLSCFLQNLKQQRSRREQFSQPPVSSSPLMANNFSKS